MNFLKPSNTREYRNFTLALYNGMASNAKRFFVKSLGNGSYKFVKTTSTPEQCFEVTSAVIAKIWGENNGIVDLEDVQFVAEVLMNPTAHGYDANYNLLPVEMPKLVKKATKSKSMLFIKPYTVINIKGLPPRLSVPKWYIRTGKRGYTGKARRADSRLPMLGKVTKFPAPTYPRLIDWINATK